MGIRRRELDASILRHSRGTDAAVDDGLRYKPRRAIDRGRRLRNDAISALAMVRLRVERGWRRADGSGAAVPSVSRRVESDHARCRGCCTPQLSMERNGVVDPCLVDTDTA